MSIPTLSGRALLPIALIAGLSACSGQTATGTLVPTPVGETLSPAAPIQRDDADAPFRRDHTNIPGGYKLLYSFKGNPDGEYASGNLAVLNGALFSTTDYGGNGDGTLFKVSTSGTEQTIRQFSGANGIEPIGGPVSASGALYGATYSGGKSDLGTIFRATSSGKVTVLHSFSGVGSSQDSTDGAGPVASLLAYNGSMYGTTYEGGWCASSSSGCGTVFSIGPSGTYHLLYSFQGTSSGSSDGVGPYADLVELQGKLYGTTSYGGACGVGGGCGTVFTISTSGKEKVLYRFKSTGGDGITPYAGLVVLNGKLYGATEGGGAHGFGTIFEITAAGTEHVLYSFQGSTDGAYPQGDLANINGTLYGTARQAGAYSLGTVFRATTAGKVTVLHSFGATGDGEYPSSGLTNLKGTLYGTTLKGGAGGYGTVFAVTP